MKQIKLFTTMLISVLSLSISAQIPSYIPKSGLVGWWPFNGNANDESGNGNHGVINGATLTKDRNGLTSSCFSFNSVKKNSVYINNFNINYSGITLSYWFNTSDTTITQRIISHDWNNGGSIGTHIDLKSGQFGYLGYAFRKTDFNEFGYLTNFKINKNKWYNLTVTYDGDSSKLYLNGSFITSVYGKNWKTSQKTLFIGGDSYYPFSGEIDDVCIWNRALDYQEVVNLYKGCTLFSINTEPINQAVKISENAQFQVFTTDTAASFQWQTDHADMGWANIPNNLTYSGILTNRISIKNIKLKNHDQLFRVIATKSICKDTSNVVALSVLDTCLTSTIDTLIINVKYNNTVSNKNNPIKVYPNPTDSELHIDFNDFNSILGYKIEIYNSSGQTVYNSTVTKQNISIDLSSWTGNGIYFVKISDKAGKSAEIKKIILR